LPHEGELPQPLEIDLTVWVTESRAGEMTVDYRELHGLVSSVLARPPLLYLETIARQIVDGAMRIAAVAGARAAVRKPNVALAGPVDHAEVVVHDGVCS